eukprot:8855799-Alexandrium_andersonii.AAC.1
MSFWQDTALKQCLDMPRWSFSVFRSEAWADCQALRPSQNCLSKRSPTPLATQHADQLPGP